ncbi:hypothetical protein [Polaribacter vadi]|uniref:hypothetical protein n=1 Tax=Polaribacter vadi TaxID=1774273 RepID=UPI0030EF7FA2|tara:strand:- start:14830 stop:15267 length:438 start_codon:yes stop_codon:yes gene_type:complete
MRPIRFTSVHDYLDKLFDGGSPSEEAIISAKKDYWRAYNTALKRRQRQKFPVFQISFSKEDVLVLKSRLAKGQKISSYIYDLVIQHLKGESIPAKQVNTALIEQQLFLIAEYLRELLDYNAVDSEKINRLEAYIMALENVIQETL